MALTICTNKGTYDVPKDFSIEIENLSPVYSEKGSQSISATLPASNHNMEMVGHLHRIDISKAPEKDVAATIADGIYRRTGKQNITSASKKDGIVSNIGFDESIMYSAWTDVSLKKLPNLPVYKPSGGVSDLIVHLTNVMNYAESANYYVFPIQISAETVNDISYPEYINHVELISDVYDLKKNARTEQIVSDGSLTSVSVPAGYGISPFLKVSKILDLIFSAYGYKLIENPFSTHYQLKKMVVLNNVKDTIVEGAINYKDLMPDCTINEFLDSLYCRTGAKIYVNGDTKTARVILIRDSITTAATEDWTLLRSSELIPTFSEPKQIKLSANTSFTGAEAKADNFEEFLEKYNGIIYENGPWKPSYLPADRYMVYKRATGMFYRTNPVTKTHTLISSDFFPWDKKSANIDYEEITGNDECVPMAIISDNILYPQYLAGAVHNHTTISASETTSDENKVNTPLAFCFSIGKSHIEGNSAITYYFGSSLCRDSSGERFKDPDGNIYNYSFVFRGEDGAFNRFFKEYDAILRHANHVFDGEINLDKSQLSRIDTSKPVIVYGQKLMIESVKYSLPLKKSKPSTVKLRSTKLLKPYDLETEQGLIQMKDQLYGWKVVEYSLNACNAQLEVEAKAKWGKTVAEIKAAGADLSIYSITLITQVSDADFSTYLPPTQADAIAKKEILNSYKATFVYRYTFNGYMTGFNAETNYLAGIQAYTI